MRAIFNDQALPYLRQLWRYKWLSAAIAWLICAVGWSYVAVMPPRYEASTRVYLNVDQILAPLLRGLAVEDNPARQLDYLQRTLLSRPNLEQVIKVGNLDTTFGAKDSDAKESLFARLTKNVHLGAQTETLITIGYSDSDPVLAKNVVQALLTVFSENIAGGNRNQMENAKRFIDQELQVYEDQLRAAERRRAEFRAKYMDLLPSYDGTLSRLDAGRKLIAQLKLDEADARSRRDSLHRDLDSIPKSVSVESAGPQVIIAGQATGYRARLDAARAKLDELRSRFTDKHPDIIALQKTISELEGKAAKESDPATGRKSETANPTYEQVKLRLVEADMALTGAERRLKQAEDEQALLDERARATPEVQIQADDLDRDYGVKKRNYDEFLQRREQTRVAEAADTKAEKIQFRVIDPPQVPSFPVSPNRPLLLSGVLLAALGCAIILPILLLQLDKSFTTVPAIRALGLPVVGSVSWLLLPSGRRRIKVQVAALFACGGILIAIYAALLVYGIGFHRWGLA